MRTFVATLACTLVLAAPAGAASRFVIKGRGYGHGVGMSQWGAEGLAAHGGGYRAILAHYYPDTSLGRSRNVTVRVLLAGGRARVAISSRGRFRVTDARGRSFPLRAGRHVLAPGLRLGRRLVLRPPLRFVPGLTPLALDGAGYRGELVVRGGAGSLSVVDELPLERYLRGVVPWEMPSHWRAAALAAQAVAARTYALAVGRDLYADTRDQVYGGIRAEDPATNRAIGVTAGLIVTWAGRPALTFYSSTSGGRTEAVADALPWVRQVPYLVSVPDPYDSISPHHFWGPVAFAAETLARRLGVPGVRSLALERDGAGRVAEVTARWHGGSRRLTGRAFQAALGLPSTWFSLGGHAAPQLRAGSSAGGWPARGAYTVVLDSVPSSAGPAAAQALAGRARRAGVPGVGVLRSDEFGSLAPGYYVVYSGVYGSPAPAQAATRRLAGRFPAAYPRLVKP